MVTSEIRSDDKEATPAAAVIKTIVKNMNHVDDEELHNLMVLEVLNSNRSEKEKLSLDETTDFVQEIKRAILNHSTQLMGNVSQLRYSPAALKIACTTITHKNKNFKWLAIKST